MRLGQEQIDSGNIHEAMQDILAIRRSINSFQSSKDGKISESGFRVNVLVQAVALFFLIALIAIEVFGGDLITNTLLNYASNPASNAKIIAAIGLFLAFCCGIMYFTVRRAAVATGEELDHYIKRNFIYLQNLSLFTDLAVKLCVIGALILGQKPAWVAPFLFIFTGDYLIQGRFFTLSLRASQILAVASFIGGALMFYFSLAEVRWPLIWFFVVTVFSLTRLSKMKRVEG